MIENFHSAVYTGCDYYVPAFTCVATFIQNSGVKTSSSRPPRPFLLGVNSASCCKDGCLIKQEVSGVGSTFVVVGFNLVVFQRFLMCLTLRSFPASFILFYNINFE